jgi:hypothetical protein
MPQTKPRESSTAKLMVTFEYQVMGFKPFPIDMLRIDQCFPSNDGCSRLIQLSQTHPGHYRLSLTKIGDPKWRPREGQWKIGGWEVVPATLVIVDPDDPTNSIPVKDKRSSL